MQAEPSDAASRELLGAIVELVANWSAAGTQGAIAREVGIEVPESDVRALYTLGQLGAGTGSSGARPAELADRLRLSRPTTSKLIARLVAADLVVKTQNAADGRSATLALTAAGQRAYDRLVGAGVALVDRAVAGLRPDELAPVAGVMRRLMRAEGAAEEPDGPAAATRSLNGGANAIEGETP